MLDSTWHLRAGREFEVSRGRREATRLRNLYERYERLAPGWLTSTVRDLARVGVVVAHLPSNDVVLLDSAAGKLKPDVVVAALLGFVPVRPRWTVALIGEMFQRKEGPIDLVHRAMMRLANRGIDVYIVHSSEEMEEFPKIWGVDPEKMRLNVYFASVQEQEAAEARDQPVGDFVFAGGNALRDYRPILTAAAQMPEQRFVLATHRLSEQDLPRNVWAGQLSHAEFVRAMASAAVVVTPIRKGLSRAAGQQTYLNAMLLEKVSIVNGTGVWGVRDHIEDGVNGLIVDGSPRSWVDAIRWALDSANADEVATMRSRARSTVESSFMFADYRERIESILNALIVDSVA